MKYSEWTIGHQLWEHMHPDNHLLYTFRFFPFLHWVQSPTSLRQQMMVQLQSNGFYLWNLKTQYTSGCFEVITLKVNINVFDSYFQCCNRHGQLLHTYHLTP